MVEMCVEGGIFFKIIKRDSTFIREMRVPSPSTALSCSLVSMSNLKLKSWKDSSKGTYM